MSAMASGFVAINQSVAVGDGSGSITFTVNSKPYGFLLSCDNDDSVTGLVTKRAGGMWTDYGGGQYVGRYCVMRNATPDYYNLATGQVVYDDTAGTLTVTPSASGNQFEIGETYYLWYFTIPF